MIFLLILGANPRYVDSKVNKKFGALGYGATEIVYELSTAALCSDSHMLGEHLLMLQGKVF